MTLYSKLKHYPFPFKGAIWAFWFLASAPTIWSAVFPCVTNTDYFYSAYPVLVLLSCVWEAHAKWLVVERPVHLKMIFPVMSRSASNLLILVFFSLVIAIPAAFFLPTYQCYSDRAKVAELILATSPLRSEIEERFRDSGTTEKSGLNIRVKTEGRVSAGFVSDSGTIVLISESPAAVVTMTPKFMPSGDGKLKWKCMGYPQKITPLNCRDEEPK